MKIMIKNNQKKLIFNHCLKNAIFVLSFLLICCFGFLFFNFSSFPDFEKCVAENTEHSKRYAKAKENCFLFKTSDVSNSNFSNVYFCVPKTYFVTILAEISSSVFKAEYKGKIGFVSADSVLVSSFIPIVPTLDDVYVDVSNYSGTQIRRTPTADNFENVIVNVGAGTKRLEYVSFIESDKPVGGNSNVWFYVIYYPEFDSTAFYEGYVYSEKMTNLTSFLDNLENNPEIEKDETVKKNNVDKNFKIILLVLILLPVVLVFVLVAFRSKNYIKIKDKDCENLNENQSQKISRKSVDSLKGKHFVKKKNENENETEFETEISGISPRFPTYDIVDDDDLLWLFFLIFLYIIIF